MKHPGIRGAVAAAVLALAAVTMQVSPPHAAAHDETADSATVTVQHWACGTYTPGAHLVHNISVRVTSLERSAPRTSGVRSVTAPATISPPVPDNSGSPGVPQGAGDSDRPFVSETTPSPATPAPRRGA